MRDAKEQRPGSARRFGYAVCVFCSLAVFSTVDAATAPPVPAHVEKGPELPKCDTPRAAIGVVADPSPNLGSAGAEIPHEQLAQMVTKVLAQSGCYVVSSDAPTKLNIAGRIALVHVAMGVVDNGVDLGATSIATASIALSLASGSRVSKFFERSSVRVVSMPSGLVLVGKYQINHVESPAAGQQVAIQEAVQITLSKLLLETIQ